MNRFILTTLILFAFSATANTQQLENKLNPSRTEIEDMAFDDDTGRKLEILLELARSTNASVGTDKAVTLPQNLSREISESHRQISLIGPEIGRFKSDTFAELEEIQKSLVAIKNDVNPSLIAKIWDHVLLNSLWEIFFGKDDDGGVTTLGSVSMILGIVATALKILYWVGAYRTSEGNWRWAGYLGDVGLVLVGFVLTFLLIYVWWGGETDVQQKAGDGAATAASVSSNVSLNEKRIADQLGNLKDEIKKLNGRIADVTKFEPQLVDLIHQLKLANNRSEESGATLIDYLILLLVFGNVLAVVWPRWREKLRASIDEI